MARFADKLLMDSMMNKGRSPGLEYGVVFDNEDPEGLGRIRVTLPWHREGQEASHWFPRLGGGGNSYGETDSIPQKGEMVSVLFVRGDLHHGVYLPSTWTVGGKGSLGAIPPNLPPHLKNEEVHTNPNHDPAKGKYKISFKKTLSGFSQWVGEGLDWLRWTSPKGVQLDIEHDVPVGGKTKDDAKDSLPYHRIALTTPTGHKIESVEWLKNGINNLSISHTQEMDFSMSSNSNSGDNAVSLRLSGHSIQISKGQANRIQIISEGGQSVLIDDDSGEIIATANNLARIQAPTVELQASVQANVIAPSVDVRAGINVTVDAPTIDLNASSVTINAASVGVGGPGGQPAARKGDAVKVDIATGLGVIIGGSGIVRES